MCQSSKRHLHAQIPTFSIHIPNQLDIESKFKEFFHTHSTINIIILWPIISLPEVILLHISNILRSHNLQHLIHKISNVKCFNYYTQLHENIYNWSIYILLQKSSRV